MTHALKRLSDVCFFVACALVALDVFLGQSRRNTLKNTLMDFAAFLETADYKEITLRAAQVIKFVFIYFPFGKRPFGPQVFIVYVLCIALPVLSLTSYLTSLYLENKENYTLIADSIGILSVSWAPISLLMILDKMRGFGNWITSYILKSILFTLFLFATASAGIQVAAPLHERAQEVYHQSSYYLELTARLEKQDQECMDKKLADTKVRPLDEALRSGFKMDLFSGLFDCSSYLQPMVREHVAATALGIYYMLVMMSPGIMLIILVLFLLSIRAFIPIIKLPVIAALEKLIFSNKGVLTLCGIALFGVVKFVEQIVRHVFS